MDRNKENKEEVILQESAKLFRQKGYSATSMGEMATAVGLFKASLYHYFESKEEILYKLTKPPLEAGVDLLCEIVESDLTPENKLKKAIQNHLGQIDHYSVKSFMLSEQDLNCVSDEMRTEIALLMNRYDQLWRDIITEGISTGHFRKDLNVKIITYAILGMCNYLFNWYRKGDVFSIEQITEQFITFISSGLLIDGAPDIPHK